MEFNRVKSKIPILFGNFTLLESKGTKNGRIICTLITVLRTMFGSRDNFCDTYRDTCILKTKAICHVTIKKLFFICIRKIFFYFCVISIGHSRFSSVKYNP